MEMPQFFQALLEHIVNSRLLVLETKTIEMDATPVEQVTQEIQDTVENQRKDMREEVEPFRRALIAAYQGYKAGKPAIQLHQNIPAENAMADALISYLVRPDLASVVTDGTGPANYVYTIEVNWPALAAVAGEVGLDLKSNLEQATNSSSERA